MWDIILNAINNILTFKLNFSLINLIHLLNSFDEISTKYSADNHSKIVNTKLKISWFLLMNKLNFCVKQHEFLSVH